MNTDIDRLHDVHLGNRVGRGCGKSYLLCHKIAGYIELGLKDFGQIVVSTYPHPHRYLYDMLIGVLEEHNIRITACKGRSIIAYCGDDLTMKVTFTSGENVEKYTRGLNSLVLYDNCNGDCV